MAWYTYWECMPPYFPYLSIQDNILAPTQDWLTAHFVAWCLGEKRKKRKRRKLCVFIIIFFFNNVHKNVSFQEQSKFFFAHTPDRILVINAQSAISCTTCLELPSSEPSSITQYWFTDVSTHILFNCAVKFYLCKEFLFGLRAPPLVIHVINKGSHHYKPHNQKIYTCIS